MTLQETAVIKFNAESEMARQMFQAIGDGFDRLERKTDHLNRKQLSLGNSINSLASNYISWQGAISGATRMLEYHNNELAKSATLAREAEEAAMKFAIQSGKFGMTTQEFSDRLNPIAVKNKTSLETTRAVATQLMSSGFDAESVLEGGATGEFLQTMQALTVAGKNVNSEELAKAAVKWLEATRQPKTAAGLRAAGNQVFNLYGDSDLQMSDMVDLAGAAKGMTAAGMSPSEILAMYSTVLGTAKSPADASTAIGSMVTKLAGKKNDPAFQAVLKRAGMKPGDVDFVGENINEVLDRLAGGLERLPEDQRIPFLTGLFGEERIAAGAGLISQRGDIRRRTGIMGGAANYQAAIDRYQSTGIATDAQLDALVDSIKPVSEGDMIRHNEREIKYHHDVWMQQQGMDWFDRMTSRWTANAAAYLMPEGFYQGTIKRGRGPGQLEQLIEQSGKKLEFDINLKAPGGGRAPATMSPTHKALQNGPG